MICIPIIAETNAAVLDLLAAAAGEPADLHELRLDALREPPRVEDLVAASSRPVIATCRSVKEGGHFAGGDRERRDILARAARAGARYLDLEPADLDELRGVGNATLIASLHDFDKTPDNLTELVLGLAALESADWVKFAVTPRRPTDNLIVFEALARCPKPAIGIAMGELGLVTRVLGGRFGSRVTFGSLRRGVESAPGQPTARELAEVYRVKRITPSTSVYGVRDDGAAAGANHIECNRRFSELALNAVCLPLAAADTGELLAVLDSVSTCGCPESGQARQKLA